MPHSAALLIGLFDLTGTKRWIDSALQINLLLEIISGVLGALDF